MGCDSGTYRTHAEKPKCTCVAFQAPRQPQPLQQVERGPDPAPKPAGGQQALPLRLGIAVQGHLPQSTIVTPVCAAPVIAWAGM